MQQNQWERLWAQLAWHDLSSFCFCLRISCYIFSFISLAFPPVKIHVILCLIISSPTELFFLYFWPAGLKGWVSKYLRILFPYISKTRVYWCHCLLLMYVADWPLGRMTCLSFLPLPSALSSPLTNQSTAAPWKPAGRSLLATAPLKKKKAECLQSVAQSRLGIESWNSPATFLRQNHLSLARYDPSFDWAQKSVKAK